MPEYRTMSADDFELAWRLLGIERSYPSDAQEQCRRVLVDGQSVKYLTVDLETHRAAIEEYCQAVWRQLFGSCG